MSKLQPCGHMWLYEQQPDGKLNLISGECLWCQLNTIRDERDRLLENHRYRVGACVHLKRWPEPGPRQVGNAGWIVVQQLPGDYYSLVHVRGGSITVHENDIAYEVEAGIQLEDSENEHG